MVQKKPGVRPYNFFPSAGPTGLFLISFFTCIAAYTSSRLPIIWQELEKDHLDMTGSLRDPYPTLAERAGLEIGTKTSKAMRAIVVGKLQKYEVSLKASQSWIIRFMKVVL